jgi:predicted Zn-dependent protease
MTSAARISSRPGEAFGMTLRPQFAAVLLLGLLVPLAGCDAPSDGEGPGHRQQELALSPEQELALGRRAYREVLAESRVLPHDSKEVKRVTHVGERIAQTVKIEPLMREINLHVSEYRFEWEFNVLVENQVNAFCLPGGKVAVFTGLLHVVANDDQLAAVLGHEVAHALAHHTSERLARQAREGGGLLAALRARRFDREQESEADHIGVFLMTFAGYDPRQAVAFWQRMKQLSDKQGQIPEILSDHPSDAQRIAQLRQWVPKAEAAKKAYDEGRIAPAHGR